MARHVYAAELIKGLTTPFPDYREVLADTVDSKGGFQAKIKLLDCVNAMPTEVGYTSFFGEGHGLGTIPETEYVQEVIALRTPYNIMLLVAMGHNGLYIMCPASDDVEAPVAVSPVPTIAHLIAQWEVALGANGGFDWVKVAGCAIPSPNPWKLWTYAIVKNKVYFYQQGLGKIIEITDAPTNKVVINEYNPTSIIGTVDAIVWHITGALDTDAAGCGTTTQTIAFTPAIAGAATLNLLNKAHYAAAAPQRWQEAVSLYLGAQLTI